MQVPDEILSQPIRRLGLRLSSPRLARAGIKTVKDLVNTNLSIIENLTLESKTEIALALVLVGLEAKID